VKLVVYNNAVLTAQKTMTFDMVTVERELKIMLSSKTAATCSFSVQPLAHKYVSVDLLT